MLVSKRRLTADLKFLNRNLPVGISGAPRADNIKLWDAIIVGLPDTLWDTGIFKLELQFRDDYPLSPPSVRFVSNMFHPNVYNNGRFNIFENEWSPAFGVASVLIAIQWLLCEPNPKYDANEEAARLYREDRTEYETKVREIVKQSWLSI